MSSSPRGPRRARRTPAVVARASLAAVLVPALLAGCSSTPGQHAANDEPGVTKATDPASAPLDIKTSAIAGTIPVADRPRLTQRVGVVIDRWFDAAFLGDYPRTDFSTAFASFTPRAATEARADGDLMSNAHLASALTSVTATRRRVRLDVLAVHQHAVGVTARFELDLTLKGQHAGSSVVSGQVDLTYVQNQGWRIFGYDVKRGGV